MARPDVRGSVALVLALVVAGVAVAAASAGAWYRWIHENPHRIWYGVHVDEGDPGAYRAFATRLSREPRVVSMFVRLDSPSIGRRLAAIEGRGQVPLVTLEPWLVTSPWGDPDQPSLTLRALASGSYDALLASVGRQLAVGGHPVLLRFAHEANGDWYPWSVGHNGNSAADYVAAWRHVREVVDAQGVRARWLWSPAAVQLTPGSDDLAAFYPGDRWVDLVGMSGYARAPGETPQQTFGPTLGPIRELTRLPIVVAETGAAGPTRGDWLRALSDWVLANRDVEGIVYFDTSPESTGASDDYRLDDDPYALEAFDRALRAVTRRRRGR